MDLHLYQWLVLGGAVLTLLYYLAALYCGWDFFRRRNSAPDDFFPGVSVLKPMHGLDREAYENLASFCEQDYPRYEILFGFDNEHDFAIPVVQKVISDFPKLPIRILVGSTARGSNNKVVKLCRLAREASFDLLVASDSDTRVAPDYLRRVVAPFSNSGVAAVSCLYGGMAIPNLWSQLEALHLSTDFLSSALVARKLGMSFTLGATMATRRSALAEIGGFQALADMAAEDHELGKRLGQRGYKVDFVDGQIQTACSSSNFREFFRHHVRWSVVTRDSKPWGHLGFVLGQGLPWVIAAAIVAPSRTLALAFVASYLVLRLGVAIVVGANGLRDPLVKRKWWLLPLSDALGFLVWLSSLFVNRVYWQGAAYDVRRGRLVMVNPSEGPTAAPSEGESSAPLVSQTPKSLQ